MSTLPIETISRLLDPYLGSNASPIVYTQLSTYLDLLLKWNARTNLTAIREPEEIVRRHFGESLFAARHLPPTATLLDLGSGAGFPGLPIQLLRPEIKVTLAESQNKKATFLREVIRTLGLSTQVWAARAETMPPTCQFETVALRAVDNMSEALGIAATISSRYIAILASRAPEPPDIFPFRLTQSFTTPESTSRVLQIFTLGADVPRGT